MASRGALGACRGTKAPVLPAYGLPKGAGLQGPARAPLCFKWFAEGKWPKARPSTTLCWPVVYLAEGNGAYKAWPEHYTRRAETLAQQAGSEPTRPKCKVPRLGSGPRRPRPAGALYPT